MFYHIVLNHGKWSVGFVLDFNDLASTNKHQQRVLKQFAEVRKEWREQIQDNSLTKKAPSYNNDLLVAQQNIKSLQERLLELETEQGRMDGWIDECHMWTNERMTRLTKGWIYTLTKGYMELKDG